VAVAALPKMLRTPAAASTVVSIISNVEPATWHRATAYFCFVDAEAGWAIKVYLLVLSWAMVVAQIVAYCAITVYATQPPCFDSNQCPPGSSCATTQESVDSGKQVASKRCFYDTLIDYDDDGGYQIGNIEAQVALRSVVTVLGMTWLDWFVLVLAGIVIALSLASELRDVVYCHVTAVAGGWGRNRPRRPVSKRYLSWALPFWLLNSVVRGWIVPPLLLGAVRTLVIHRGADAVSICLNAVAILFLLDIDQLAYTFGLAEELKDRVDTRGREAAELGPSETRVIDGSKLVFGALVPATIVASVLIGRCKTDPIPEGTVLDPEKVTCYDDPRVDLRDSDGAVWAILICFLLVAATNAVLSDDIGTITDVIFRPMWVRDKKEVAANGDGRGLNDELEERHGRLTRALLLVSTALLGLAVWYVVFQRNVLDYMAASPAQPCPTSQQMKAFSEWEALPADKRPTYDISEHGFGSTCGSISFPGGRDGCYPDYASPNSRFCDCEGGLVGETCQVDLCLEPNAPKCTNGQVCVGAVDEGYRPDCVLGKRKGYSLNPGESDRIDGFPDVPSLCRFARQTGQTDNDCGLLRSEGDYVGLNESGCRSLAVCVDPSDACVPPRDLDDGQPPPPKGRLVRCSDVIVRWALGEFDGLDAELEADPDSDVYCRLFPQENIEECA